MVTIKRLGSTRHINGQTVDLDFRDDYSGWSTFRQVIVVDCQDENEIVHEAIGNILAKEGKGDEPRQYVR